MGFPGNLLVGMLGKEMGWLVMRATGGLERVCVCLCVCGRGRR